MPFMWIMREGDDHSSDCDDNKAAGGKGDSADDLPVNQEDIAKTLRDDISSHTGIAVF